MSKASKFNEDVYRNMINFRTLRGRFTKNSASLNINFREHLHDDRHQNHENDSEPFVEIFGNDEVNDYSKDFNSSLKLGKYSTPYNFMSYISKYIEDNNRDHVKIININFHNLNVPYFDVTVLPTNFAYRFTFTDTKFIGDISVNYDFPLIFLSFDYFNSYYGNKQEQYFESKIFYSFFHLKYLSDFFLRESGISKSQIEEFRRFSSNIRKENHLTVFHSDSDIPVNKIKVYFYEDFFPPFESRDFYNLMVEDSLISDDVHKNDLGILENLKATKFHKHSDYEISDINRYYVYNPDSTPIRYIRVYEPDPEKILQARVMNDEQSEDE